MGVSGERKKQIYIRIRDIKEQLKERHEGK